MYHGEQELQTKKRFYTKWFTEITENSRRITKAHTEKADLIMIFTDEKKNKNFIRIFTTESREHREKKELLGILTAGDAENAEKTDYFC